jgi:hypothetical protein
MAVQVKTLEEELYRTPLHGSAPQHCRHSGAEVETQLQLSELTAAPLPIDNVERPAKGQHLVFQENQRGVTYDGVLWPLSTGHAQRIVDYRPDTFDSFSRRVI